MKNQVRIFAWVRIAAPAFLLLASAPHLFAHAILVHSNPANGEVIHQPNVEITLRYDARIDPHLSSLTLIGAGDKKIPVEREPSAKPNELQAAARDLAPGTYHIEWQALAGDGHITRGEVTFTVRQKPLSRDPSNHGWKTNHGASSTH